MQKEPRRDAVFYRKLALGLFATVIVAVAGWLGTRSVRQGEPKEFGEFLEALYTSDVTRIEVVGDTAVRWQRGVDEAVGHRVWYRADLPTSGIESLSDDLPRYVGEPATPIEATNLVAEVDDGRFRPRQAWAVLVRGDDWLFVDGKASPGGWRRYRVDFGASLPEPRDALLSRLGRHGVDVSTRSIPAPDRIAYQSPDPFWTDVLIQLIPWLIVLAIVWFVVIRRLKGTGGLLNVGRAKSTRIVCDRVTTKFSDVAGIDEATQGVREIVEFLKDPPRFSRLGARVPRGVLLVGAPGTGKTLLARAIAGEAGVPFFSIGGSDFVEMFVGVGASRVRNLFREARAHAPSVVFLDEIDAVGRRRGSGTGNGHDEREQTLNAILVELDGFLVTEGVILLAATNRPDVLDPALLRPGRFDRQIVINLPDVRGRAEILKVHTKNVKLAKDVCLETIARGTTKLSGAELANLVNEATLMATLRESDVVEQSDLEEARDIVKWGRQDKTRAFAKEDQIITAYHEAGHALIALLHEDVEPLHKVSIIPRGVALGATMMLPENDRHYTRSRQLEGIISFTYGGRIAEELVFDDVSAGAEDDLRKVTEIAQRMVRHWGMGGRSLADRSADEGPFFLKALPEGHRLSERASEQVEAEIDYLLTRCYGHARGILTDNRESLDRIARALLHYETLSGAQVKALLNGTTMEELVDVEFRPSAAT